MSFKANIKINRKKNKYKANKIFETNCLRYFFLKYNFDILENSINAKEKIHIDTNKYTILLINIKINNINKNKPVLILL